MAHIYEPIVCNGAENAILVSLGREQYLSSTRLKGTMTHLMKKIVFIIIHINFHRNNLINECSKVNLAKFPERRKIVIT